MAEIFGATRPSTGSISVALCTYNGARYLEEQLASIAHQTRKPAELVVCDDGSQDNTIAILTDYAARVDFPVCLHRNEKRLGSTRNFEQAIRFCRSEFIALADQDDWWSPAKLDTLLRALQQHSAGGVFSDGALMDENSNPTGRMLWSSNWFDDKDDIFNAKSRDYVISVLLRQNLITGATLMFRSDLREALLPFPSDWVHDGWIAWMIVLHSRLIAISEPLIRYRVHPAQQIGIPRSVGGRLRRAREMGVADNLLVDKQFRVLHDYIKSHHDVFDAELCTRIDAKRNIARFRAELSRNRIVRLFRIAARSSDYRLYTQGWLSMFKDLLI